MVHIVTTELWRFKLHSVLKRGRKVSSLFSRKGQGSLLEMYGVVGHHSLLLLSKFSTRLATQISSEWSVGLRSLSVDETAWERSRDSCCVISLVLVVWMKLWAAGQVEVRLSASLWYLEADHESWTQTKAFCASSWFSEEWRFVCQLRIEVAYESNVTYSTHAMREWILVLCKGLYTESKRKWLIQQRSKELKRTRRKRRNKW